MWLGRFVCKERYYLDGDPPSSSIFEGFKPPVDIRLSAIGMEYATGTIYLHRRMGVGFGLRFPHDTGPVVE